MGWWYWIHREKEKYDQASNDDDELGEWGIGWRIFKGHCWIGINEVIRGISWSEGWKGNTYFRDLNVMHPTFPLVGVEIQLPPYHL